MHVGVSTRLLFQSRAQIGHQGDQARANRGWCGQEGRSTKEEGRWQSEQRRAGPEQRKLNASKVCSVKLDETRGTDLGTHRTNCQLQGYRAERYVDLWV